MQTTLATAALVPVLIELDVVPVEKAPWLGGVVAAAAGLTRVMADPRVEAFLRLRVRWLAADPPQADG